MTRSKTLARAGARQPLVKNPLFIDGISRAGKFLLTNLLSGLKGVEPVQYRPVMEHVSRLQRFGLIDRKAAQQLLRTEADLACYEMLIGRNFNFRRSDKSSIFNNAGYKAYLKRLDQVDGPAALVNFYKNNLLSLFIIHEAFPNINVFFDAFPDMKVIIMQRSPVDLVYSWQQRQLGARIGRDPLLGEIPLQGKTGPIPWYLYESQAEYISLKGIDRTILSITTLFKMYDASYNKLPALKKKHIMFVRYEDILSNPQATVKAVSHFLQRRVLSGIKDIIKKEKLPNKEYLSLKEQKIEKIKSLASKKYFNKLLFLEKKYFFA
ncbi:MAG: sulfotransferase domain-containing protein [Patescibacteria group bacterium]